MNARDHVKLTQRVEAHLVEIGAVPSPDRYDWTLQTPLGELRVIVKTTHYTPLVSFFCKFKNPALAVLRFPHEVNSYSGKWNFHFGTGCTVRSAYSVFVADLEMTRDAKAIAIGASK